MTTWPAPVRQAAAAHRVLPRGAAVAALAASCFLLLLVFGSPTQAFGLDSSWMQVVAWALLHHAQWGRDLVFTYGPLGLLQPYASYVPGAFDAYLAGQVAIPAAFAAIVAWLMASAPGRLLALFAVALACTFPRLPGDVCWLLTMGFGTTVALQLLARRRVAALCIVLVVLAALFAGLALIKLSLLPVWLLSFATLLAAAIASRQTRAALCTLAFPAALPVAWLLCGQSLANLPAYVASQAELAYGYAHAMGQRAPFLAEVAALVLLGTYVSVCAIVCLRHRRDFAAVVSVAFAAALALLSWPAFFTRGDDYHWPNLFGTLAFLPFALWRNPFVALPPPASLVLTAVLVSCLAIGLVQIPPLDLLRAAQARLSAGVETLAHVAQLREQREGEWQAARTAADLPDIRARIGNARVDLLTWQQGLVIVNAFNYAPRPVFQSYSAYTPRLARLNESYFIGPDAPQFVLLGLDNSDDRFAASEDGLALLAILRRYRPELSHDNLLLLRRDDAVAAPPAIVRAGEAAQTARLGDDLRIATAAGQAQVAFLDLRLNWFGRLYTLLFREPTLYLSVRTDTGEQRRDRLVRLSASSGFLLTPVVTSAADWLRLYFSKALPTVRSIAIDTELPWERRLFEPTFAAAVQSFAPLRSVGPVAPELRAAATPDFNLAPSDGTPFRIVVEDGKDSVFLHAPGALAFRPAAGTYRISATYGLQAAALADAQCLKAAPNGVGVTVVRSSGGTDALLWHRELDPFHTDADRGPQRLLLENVIVEAGDTISYRVDPGDSGTNIACDWSYVRNLSLVRRGDTHWADAKHTRVFESGFE